MKVIRGIENVDQRYPRPVIAIGIFDGLHSGHQKLIRRAVLKARAIGGTPIVMTFHPHPVHVLRPENHLPLLVSLPFRLKLIEDLGAAVAIVARFTKKFSRLTPQQFIKNYLAKKLRPEFIIVGDDFRFGQGRSGTIEYFKEEGKKYGFRVLTLQTRRGLEKKVSSTLVRDLIAGGNLKKAERLLGRRVALMGRVERGDARGKTLGYPTANIAPSDEVLPPLGVYVARVFYKKRFYHGMANVGLRPSFDKKGHVIVEVNIFDFDKEIYGQDIIVEFLQKIRNELYFPSREALMKQLQHDEHIARTWFNHA